MAINYIQFPELPEILKHLEVMVWCEYDNKMERYFLREAGCSNNAMWSYQQDALPTFNILDSDHENMKKIYNYWFEKIMVPSKKIENVAPYKDKVYFRHLPVVEKLDKKDFCPCKTIMKGAYLYPTSYQTSHLITYHVALKDFNKRIVEEIQKYLNDKINYMMKIDYDNLIVAYENEAYEEIGRIIVGNPAIATRVHEAMNTANKNKNMRQELAAARKAKEEAEAKVKELEAQLA